MLQLKIWKDVFKQLARNKRQSFLTMIALAISVFVVLVILSSSAYTTKQLATDLEVTEGETVTLTYTPKDSSYLGGFTEADQSLIKSILNHVQVETTSSHYDVTVDVAYGGSHQQLEFRSYDDLLAQDTLIPTLIAGKDLASLSAGDEIALSDDAAKALARSEDVTEILDKTITIKEKNFKVVAIYYASSLRTFLPQLILSQSGKEVLLDHQEYYDQLTLHTRDFDLVNQALEALDKSGSHRLQGSYAYIDNVKLYEDNREQVQVILTFIALLSGISIFVSGFGVMNAMLSSISERHKEIAIRRALGARKKDIQRAYMIEGSLLAILGGLVGLAVTLVFMLVMNSLGLTASLSLFQILMTLGLTLVSGSIFSLLPSLVASQKNVVEGLK